MTGRLLYLMGASGAGKDTILQGLENRLGDKVHIAPRVITRPCTPTEQRAISVTPAQFDAMQARHHFAMTWHANGLAYGIQNDIHQHLTRGRTVVINGSRAYLPQATHDFPQLQPILLHVDTDMLSQRLAQRKRETCQQIQHRLDRNAQFHNLHSQHTGKPIIHIDNSGPAEHAIITLCEFIDHPPYNHKKRPVFAQDYV